MSRFAAFTSEIAGSAAVVRELLLGKRFEFEALKGFDEPVALYEARA